MISSAAAIMVAVFLGFATEVDVVVKMLGVGMAVAILLDATVVRMVLVPATMSLLGRWNWWVPRWLDRVLPGVRAEITDEELGAAQPRPDHESRRAPARRRPLRGGADMTTTTTPAGRSRSGCPARPRPTRARWT